MNKVLIGIVLKESGNNTVIVEVVRKTPHPLYKKLLTRSKKYKADTKEVTAKKGDTVRIVETRPISKDKHFKVLKVVSAFKE